jgi:hypothetical protein
MNRAAQNALFMAIGAVSVLVTGFIFSHSLFLNSSSADREYQSDLSFLKPSSATASATVAVAGAVEQSKSAFELAKNQSFGFFDDITNDSWERLQNRVRSESLFRFPHQPDEHGEVLKKPKSPGYHSALWMMNNADPLFTCPHTLRVGGRGDGPKYVCDPHRLLQYDDCLVYSIGSRGKYEFEDGLAKLLNKHCEIHVFDPNKSFGRPNDDTKNNIHYHAWGLKSSYDTSANLARWGKGLEFLSLQDTLQRLGHTKRRIDIFKIDCEGCEWTSMKDWLSPTIDVRQILVETHLTEKDKPRHVKPSEFFQAFMTRGFVPFSKEANTHPHVNPPGTLFEYAFLRLDVSFFQKE